MARRRAIGEVLGGWAPIPLPFLCDPQNTALQVRVATILSGFAAFDLSAEDWPSAREIAGWCGVQRNAIHAALRDLESRGWVVCDHGDGDERARRAAGDGTADKRAAAQVAQLDAQAVPVGARWSLNFDRFNRKRARATVPAAPRRRYGDADQPPPCIAQDTGGRYPQKDQGGISGDTLSFSQIRQESDPPYPPLRLQGGDATNAAGARTSAKARRRATRAATALHRAVCQESVCCYLCGRRFLWTDDPADVVQVGNPPRIVAGLAVGDHPVAWVHRGCLAQRPDFSVDTLREDAERDRREQAERIRQEAAAQLARDLAQLDAQRAAWPAAPQAAAADAWRDIMTRSGGGAFAVSSVSVDLQPLAVDIDARRVVVQVERSPDVRDTLDTIERARTAIARLLRRAFAGESWAVDVLPAPPAGDIAA